jgi:hypothetical protein
LSDLGVAVLSRIFPSNRDALNTARERLTTDHFLDQSTGEPTVESVFFGLLENYADRYNDVLTGKLLKDQLERGKVDAARIVLYTETYDFYCTNEITEHEFNYAIDSLIDRKAEKRTGEAFALGFQILERGAEVDGVVVKGHDEARRYFNEAVSQIEDGLNVEEAPEGDVRGEYEKFIADYLERKTKGVTNGILFGIPSLDESTGGLQNGELCLSAAYTNEGKTQFVTQCAWNASVKQGKNVYFATSETIRDQVWRRLIARHSREPQFGLPHGLDVKKIKEGTLTSDEEGVMIDVLHDFNSDNYGIVHIAQMPRNATVTYMENSITRQQKKWNVDLAIDDYIALFRPEIKRGNEREEFNDNIRRVKTFITAFDKGRGLPFISPWQMTRDAYKVGRQSNGYTIGSLSDTSEAEKSADLIISLLRPEPTATEAIIQTLKARDSALMNPTTIYLDYRNSYLGESPSSFSSSGGGFSAADSMFESIGIGAF